MNKNNQRKSFDSVCRSIRGRCHFNVDNLGNTWTITCAGLEEENGNTPVDIDLPAALQLVFGGDSTIYKEDSSQPACTR
jgi:hypothetical protein